MKRFYTDYVGLMKEKDVEIRNRKEIDKALQYLPFRISAHYLSLVNWEREDCPIKLQSFPAASEIDIGSGTFDACSEETILKHSCLLHRYKKRVLLITSNQCFTYCRFCTRKWFLGKKENAITMDMISNALNYVKKNKEINEVILSGGDPLILSNNQLESILDELSSINHVRIIRLGTRAPVTYPERITPELCHLLSRYDLVWIMTHFNNANEVVEESISACRLLRKSGLPVLNQTVLLRNINDSATELRILFTKLVEIGVKPYYLYFCDHIPGTSHFWVSTERTKSILNDISQEISGLALPIFVIVDSQSWKKRIIFDKNVDLDSTFEEVEL